MRFVDPADPEAFRAARPTTRTRAYYAETLPNPKLTVFPIAEVAAIGRELGIPLIVDNTAAPILSRPLEHGAAIVVYSTTKYIGGHGTSIGGVIVDGGNFDWEAHTSASPPSTRPTRAIMARSGPRRSSRSDRSPISSRRASTLLRDLGAALRPFNAFLILQGIETLALRIERHARTPRRSPTSSQRHKVVRGSSIPRCRPGERSAGRPLSHGRLRRPRRLRTRRRREAGRKFIDSLELFYHVANIGDSRSLAIHPATTTHSQLSAEDQLATGVTAGYVRLRSASSTSTTSSPISTRRSRPRQASPGRRETTGRRRRIGRLFIVD